MSGACPHMVACPFSGVPHSHPFSEVEVPPVSNKPSPTPEELVRLRNAARDCRAVYEAAQSAAAAAEEEFKALKAREADTFSLWLQAKDALRNAAAAFCADDARPSRGEEG